jgi:hypothetical protein
VVVESRTKDLCLLSRISRRSDSHGEWGSERRVRTADGWAHVPRRLSLALVVIATAQVVIYIQTVWRYGAVKAGVAWVPFPITLIALNVSTARVLVTRLGVRPLLILGPLLTELGFVWLSRLSPTGDYWTDLLAPMLVVSIGVGRVCVPLTLMVVSYVDHMEAGAATQSVQRAILFYGLTVGFSTGLTIAGLVALSGFVVALVTTWMPGHRWRVFSSRHDRQLSCDEVLGTSWRRWRSSEASRDPLITPRIHCGAGRTLRPSGPSVAP